MLRQGRLKAVVVTFLIGCVVLLVLSASGVRAETSQEKEQQGHTQATDTEQGHSGAATSEEEARCQGTRTIDLLAKSPSSSPAPVGLFVTNDLPGCPNKGGLLSGTEEPDKLYGGDGEDEVRGLGARDKLSGGLGGDVIYGGRGGDELVAGAWVPLEFYADRSENVLYGGPGRDSVNGDAGDDVLYGGAGDDKFIWGGMGGADTLHGGDGNDYLKANVDKQPDKLYCGRGKDEYLADKNDYVDDSCEKKPKNLGPRGSGGGSDYVVSATPSASASPFPLGGTGGPAILVPAAVLLLGSGVLTYAILRRS
jgi:hypothetical protein